MRTWWVGLLVGILVGVPYAALALDNNFVVELTTGGQTYKQGFNTIEDGLNGLDRAQLTAMAASYTDVSAASITFWLMGDEHGLPIYLSAAAGSPTLTLSIPSIGVNQTFAGATRDASIDLLGDWLETNGASSLEALMRELAKRPNNILAGGPESVQGTMIQQDFSDGFMHQTSILADRADGQGNDNENQFHFGMDYFNIDQGGARNQGVTLPLSYAFVSNQDYRERLTLRMPLSMSEVRSAKSYQVGLGVSYSKPINPQWVLTPALNYGMGASLDLGAVAQMVGTSVTSAYTIPLGEGQKLHIGNLLGYYSTLKFSYGDYSYDPDVHNTVLRTGVMYSFPLEVATWARGSALELFFVDTRLFGTDVHTDAYDEVGVAYGLMRRDQSTEGGSTFSELNNFRVGVSYYFAGGANGVKANFGYTF